MSPQQLNTIIKQITNQSILRWVLVLFFGVGIGIAGGRLVASIFAAPVYKNNSTNFFSYGPFLGIDITRTRTSWCDLHLSRVLKTTLTLNDTNVSVLLPTQTDNFIYPYLGKQRFAVLVKLDPELPDGQWIVQTTFADTCHWWSFITGPEISVTDKPFKVQNHKLVTTGMEVVNNVP